MKGWKILAYFFLFSSLFIVVTYISWWVFFEKTESYQSDYFNILNLSDASYLELRNLSVELENGRNKTCRFLEGRRCDDTINVIVSEGREIPSAIGGILQLYRYNGRIDDALIIHDINSYYLRICEVSFNFRRPKCLRG